MEEAFYKPFADWLVNELEECTKAVPVGRNIFKDKWGTPDVVGVREPRKSDISKFPTDIVSAEIKLDSTGLITAFEQACAYLLYLLPIKIGYKWWAKEIEKLCVSTFPTFPTFLDHLRDEGQVGLSGIG